MKKYIISFTILSALIVAFGIYNYLRIDQQIRDAYLAGARWGCLQAKPDDQTAEEFCTNIIGE